MRDVSLWPFNGPGRNKSEHGYGKMVQFKQGIRFHCTGWRRRWFICPLLGNQDRWLCDTQWKPESSVRDRTRQKRSLRNQRQSSLIQQYRLEEPKDPTKWQGFSFYSTIQLLKDSCRENTASERSRTSTSLRTQGPKPCASASSATLAFYQAHQHHKCAGSIPSVTGSYLPTPPALLTCRYVFQPFAGLFYSA